MLMFLSCSKKERVPEGILTENQMVTVLAELYIIEQKISTLGVKRDSLTQIFGAMKGRAFEKTGIAESVFNASLNYYVDHPQSLETIYTVLIDSLNLREQRLISSEATK
jgi:Domain of unknown function (DUF4296)